MIPTSVDTTTCASASPAAKSEKQSEPYQILEGKTLVPHTLMAEPSCAGFYHACALTAH